MVHKNLIWSESAQWLLSSCVHKIPDALIPDSRSLYYSHGHAHVTPMGKCPWRCTSRGWDSSNELDLGWIGRVVSELWAGQMDRRTETIPLFPCFPLQRVGEKSPLGYFPMQCLWVSCVSMSHMTVNFTHWSIVKKYKDVLAFLHIQERQEQYLINSIASADAMITQGDWASVGIFWPAKILCFQLMES